MRVGVLYSGGKDSNFAMYSVRNKYDIEVLITLKPSREDSYLYHSVNIDLVELQAKSMEIPIIKYPSTEDEYDDLKKVIEIAKREYKIEGIVTGAIRSNFQYTRFKKACEENSLEIIAPLWNIDEIRYMRSLLENNFQVIIVGWFAYPLRKDLLGRVIDERVLNDLIELNRKYGISIVGEGGEIETFVLYQPMFKKKIVIEDYILEVGNNYGVFKITKAKLE